MLIMLLSSRPYSFTDETSGEVKTGTSIRFISNQSDMTNDVNGCQPMKASVTQDSIRETLAKTQFPAVCDVDIEIKAGAADKAGIVFTSIKVLKPFGLAPLMANLAKAQS